VHESHAPQESLAAPAATGRDFAAILDKGDYAGAIKFVEQSSVPTSEKDGLKGNLILDGWVDPAAVSRPPYPLVTGFDSLERAALAGRSQSITDLRAKLTTGINFEGKNVLMAPNPPLAQCWARVEAATEQPATCVALRRQLKVPQG
jgi:hypothetical protein